MVLETGCSSPLFVVAAFSSVSALAVVSVCAPVFCLTCALRLAIASSASVLTLAIASAASDLRLAIAYSAWALTSAVVSV